MRAGDAEHDHEEGREHECWLHTHYMYDPKQEARAVPPARASPSVVRVGEGGRDGDVAIQDAVRELHERKTRELVVNIAAAESADEQRELSSRLLLEQLLHGIRNE